MSTDVASDFDVGDEGAALVAPDRLALLHDKIKELAEQQNLVAQLEEELKQAKTHLHTLRKKELPELMLSLRIPKHTADIGNMRYDIALEDAIEGSIPIKDPERRRKAIEWLEQNDAAAIIKGQIVVPVPRSHHKAAIELLEVIQERGWKVVLDSTVHPQTLWAFARERMRDGKPFEPEVLGLSISKTAKVKEHE